MIYFVCGGFGWLWTRRHGFVRMYVSRTDGFVWIARREKVGLAQYGSCELKAALRSPLPAVASCWMLAQAWP